MAVNEGPWTMEILVDGRPLDELGARGTTYIEAARNREYAIRLRNRTPERVAVALSVDGLNTIDAKTTSATAGSKWILAPWQTITLTGWQTGPETARRFFFTTEDGSYGAWLGKTENLGTIAAAFFRERRPVPAPAPIDRPRNRRFSSGEPQSAPSRGAGESMDKRSDRMEESLGRDALSDEYAATGIGREVGHTVRRVPFDAEARPAAVLRVRYEYHDALVRLGVLPRPAPECDSPLARRERAHGFEDMDFAPDPYR
jgi:hypothetical protein